MELERERIKIEQRIIKELPTEITTQVKETVNQELMRLRNEVGYQQNNLGEQLLNIRGQIIQTNEEKAQVEDELTHLKRELKKTQWVDEIRQREIYNAFVRGSKPDIILSNVHRLQNDENILFNLPSRPKPYFTSGDPYYDPNKALHLKKLITSTGSSLHPQHTTSYADKSYNQVYVDQICGLGRDVWNYQDELELETSGQRPGAHRPVSPELDVNQILKKNQSRLDNIQEISDLDKQWTSMDTALFDNAMKKERGGFPATHYDYAEQDERYDNLLEGKQLD